MGIRLEGACILGLEANLLDTASFYASTVIPQSLSSKSVEVNVLRYLWAILNALQCLGLKPDYDMYK